MDELYTQTVSMAAQVPCAMSHLIEYDEFSSPDLKWHCPACGKRRHVSPACHAMCDAQAVLHPAPRVDNRLPRGTSCPVCLIDFGSAEGMPEGRPIMVNPDGCRHSVHYQCYKTFLSVSPHRKWGMCISCNK